VGEQSFRVTRNSERVIYICIPAHNEEQTVGVVLWKIRQVMTEFRRDYQIIVADDASTDATPAVLAPYARVLPLTILRNPERRGYAASLEMLLREAVTRAPYPKRDVIVTLQADFTDDPQDLVTLVKQIEAGADIVTGDVQLPDSTPRARRWARAASAWAARRASWPDGAGDPLSSYRAYRVYTIKRALEEQAGRRLLSVDGWAANVQLLRATLPFARTSESLELTERHERMQRATRFRGWQTFRQVLAVARGKARGHGDAASIAPDGDRQARTSVVADAEKQKSHRAERAGRGERPERARGERQQRGARGERRTSGAERDARKPKRARGERAGAGTDTAAAGAPAAPAAEDAAAAEKKRRNRRGGRRRRGGTAAPSPAETGAPEAATSAADTEGAVEQPVAGADAGQPAGGVAAEQAGGEGEAKPRRRSRRGGRGGRRRRGPRAETATNGEPSADTPDSSAAPEGSGRMEPQVAPEAHQFDAAEERRQAS
jgi:hypothetical protein